MQLVRYGFAALVASMLLVSTGCPPKQPKIEETPEETAPPQADTSFSEPTPITIDTSDDVTFREADLEAEIERQVREKLRPVYFEFNSFTLTPRSSEELSEAASFLLEQSSMRVLIEGHCDERGSAEYNMGLGENRARAVKRFLQNYGIPAIRIEVTSWGKERPVRTGCRQESCHQENRRAEFKVLAR